MRWVAVVLCAVPALAGCASQSGPGPAAVPALHFPPMDLATIPLEPFEARGILRVAWEGGLMGVQTQREGGMPRFAVRQGDTLFTTQAQMGWTQWPLPEYAASQLRGFRYLAWDVPQLLAHATRVSDSGGLLQASATYQVGERAVEATVEVEHDGAEVRKAVVTTPEDPESPYTLTPAPAGLEFPLQVPAPVRTAAEVQDLDAKAREGHVAILRWIETYRQQLGRLPQDVSDQGLAVQHVGSPWPASPYDGAPMRSHVASGHFQWRYCSAQDASFSGFGWDGAPLNQGFGRGCA
ncbi:MAG: hypothetical protein LC620_06645 [Halobacteriales archaeon]|nr:hypothetical protein [Halobacteriales archaeon]